MNKILDLIDRRIDELKLKNNNNNHLELTEKEHKILKKSVIPLDLYDVAEILMYRGISIKIKEGEK